MPQVDKVRHGRLTQEEWAAAKAGIEIEEEDRVMDPWVTPEEHSKLKPK